MSQKLYALRGTRTNLEIVTVSEEYLRSFFTYLTINTCEKLYTSSFQILIYDPNKPSELHIDDDTNILIFATEVVDHYSAPRCIFKYGYKIANRVYTDVKYNTNIAIFNTIVFPRDFLFIAAVQECDLADADQK